MQFDDLGPAAGAPRTPPAPRRDPTTVATVQFAGKPIQFVAYTNTSPAHMASQIDTRTGVGPPQYGAWSNVTIAERAMGIALGIYGREIYSWCRDPGPYPFIRDVTVPFNVGRVLTADELTGARAQDRLPNAVDTQTFRFQIRTSPNPPGFYVVFADPLPPLPNHGVGVSPIATYEERPGDAPFTRGHAIARHINESTDDAIRRLDAEPDIRAAGGFNDEATLDSVVRAATDTYGREIAGWLVNSALSMPLTREVVFPRTVGWVMERDELDRARAEKRAPVPAAARGARIVLRKSADFAEGYFVVTAYPIVV